MQAGISKGKKTEARSLLEERAFVLQELRSFFSSEGLLEVETPLLRSSSTSDPYIDSLSLAEKTGQYLQSSPEFAMKELLAQQSGSIFQICKAFRGDEKGRHHRCEFTLLEWYVVNFSWQQLLQQTIRLLRRVVEFDQVIEISYAECFDRYLQIDIFSISIEALRHQLCELMEISAVESFSHDECLHLLFAEYVEPRFSFKDVTVVYDFPASQAALAKLTRNVEGYEVAQRFEVYLSGLELANAYQEESSSILLRSRFQRDNEIRQQLGKPTMDLDETFLSHMNDDFPSCSGIALGVDRLLMARLKKSNISRVLSFS